MNFEKLTKKELIELVEKLTVVAETNKALAERAVKQVAEWTDHLLESEEPKTVAVH